MSRTFYEPVKTKVSEALENVERMKEKAINRNAQGETLEGFLKRYEAEEKDKYEKPSVTVDMLVFTVTDKIIDKRKLPEKQLKVLLVKRKDHPYIGQWAIPGGFVNINENLDDAALRELKEETNVDNIYMEQLFTWGDVDRDPRMRVISASYMALIDSRKVEVTAGDDAEDCKWFVVNRETLETNTTNITDGVKIVEKVAIHLISEDEQDEVAALLEIETTTIGSVSKTTMEILNSANIAFDHIKIINYGLDRLANKLEYTPIAFNLMPPLFTLTELQRVYEVILRKELYKANFRQKIAPMVIETDKFKTEAQHRPAKLFKFNPAWRAGF